MRITLSEHAKERMRERNIPVIFVHTALLQPDKIEADRANPRRFLAKKIYPISSAGRYLLLVVYERTLGVIKVITVISTSKINKYF